MRRKIENLKPNTPVELTFLDHCSHDGGWIRLAFIKHLKLSEIKLIGYYVHSNKDFTSLRWVIVREKAITGHSFRYSKLL